MDILLARIGFLNVLLTTGAGAELADAVEHVNISNGAYHIPSYIVAICILGVIIPIIGMIIILKTYQTRESSMLLIADVICLFYNVVYALFISVESEDAAFLSMQLCLMANMLFYFFYLMFMVSYLGFKRLSKAIAVYGILVISSLMIISEDRTSSLYYDNIVYNFDNKFGFSYMTFDYGILYYVNYYFTAALMFILFGYSVYLYGKNRLAAWKINLRSMMWAQMFVAFALISKMMVNITFDYVPVFSSISVLAIGVAVVRGDFFGTINMARNRVFEQVEDGFITVNTSYAYLDSNRYAKLVFPSLKKLNPGDKLPDEILDQFTKCNLNVNEGEIGDSQKIGDKYFHTFITPLTGISPENAEIQIAELTKKYQDKALKRDEYMSKHRLICLLCMPLEWPRIAIKAWLLSRDIASVNMILTKFI